MSTIKKIISCLLMIVMAAGFASSAGPVSASAASKPAKPVIELTASKSGTSVKITIRKTDGAKGYKIYMKSPSDSKYKLIKTLKKDGTVDRSYTKKSLEAGKYSFKVKAYTKSGKKTVTGSYSKAKTVTLGSSSEKTGDKDDKGNENDKTEEDPNITVALSKEYFEDITQNDVDADVTAKGFISGKLESDGSVTYVMTKEAYRKWQAEVSDNFKKLIEMINVDSRIDKIRVKKESSNIRVTLPNEFWKNLAQEDISEVLRQKGYRSVMINEDDTYTLLMTPEQHKEWLAETVGALKDGLADLFPFPKCKGITISDDFSHINFTTSNKEPDFYELCAVSIFRSYGDLYTILSGEPLDNISIDYINSSSKKVIKTVNTKDEAEN